MYSPPQFEEKDETVLRALIEAHPLGLLISTAGSEAMANPVPFLVSLRDGAHVLVVFQGADSYVTPSWYASKTEHGKVVPTWNYAMVQARGSASVHEGADWLGPQVAELTDRHEAERPEAWKVNDAPEAFVAAQLRGIVGIEIAVTELTGKWKVSQNRPETDRRGVQAGLTAEGETAMAGLVGDRGGLHNDKVKP